MRAFAHLEPCEPGTVTPLRVLVGYVRVPDAPGELVAWPVGGWIGWDDGLVWPPHTPGTHAPDDVETDHAR